MKCRGELLLRHTQPLAGLNFIGRIDEPHSGAWKSLSGETIQAVRAYECADDTEVILRASALLDSKPEHPAVEIWEGKRLVARLTRSPTDETSQQDNVIRVVQQKDD